MSKIEQQQERFEKIKTLCMNYRKDGSSRKTSDYLLSRLTTLDALWGDFEIQHAALMAEIEDKNIIYFTGEVYEKTKAMYESTASDMRGLLNKLSGENSSVKFDLTGLINEEKGDETKRLLSKQERNFKAIDRALSKITISKFMEKWELEDNLNILKSKWADIEKFHWELDELLTGAAHERYYSMFLDIESKYDEMRRKLNSMMWTTTHYQHVAPRIEIPEFSGQYSQWISFKDLFIETIHNNPTINKAQKMQHLKTKLKGEAERLVQHLTISAENYNSCWDILNQRYDNRRLQFISFMNSMMHLPVIQQPDAYNLKKMHDVITECLSGLSNIGLDTSTWDPIIVYLMAQKLDLTSHNEYVKELQNHREIPALQDFLFFLESKFMAYETMRRPKKDIVVTQQNATYSKPFQREYATKKPNFNFNKNYPKTYYAAYGQCPFCNESHVLMQCAKFIGMDVPQRNHTVAKLQLCKNCLFSHGDKECKSAKTCKECDMKHHSLLHNDKKISTIKHENNNFGLRPSTSTQLQHAANHHLATGEMEVLLTTVQLQIQALDGSFVTLRALLDQGSQVNIITENAAQLLRLPRKKLNATISGIGELTGNCKGKIQLTCKSLHSDFTFETEALILTKLTNNLPNASFNKANWPHLENLKLADADFNVSRPVDMLLGADIYADIIMDGVLKGEQQSPIAQQTHLGWILCGKLTTKLNCHVTLINMKQLTEFWENEDVLQNNDDISKNELCEQYYTSTTQRDENGQYIVKIPVHENIEESLGKSKQIAVSQFLQLEKRLERQETLRKMYKEFINEYIELQHMTPSFPSPHLECYLPHHGVLRESMKTLGLRWNLNNDMFSFDWNIDEKKKPTITKRNLLSGVGVPKLYDPLGWMAPVTIIAKLLFQKVWETKLTWDETLPSDIKNEWLKLKTELPQINTIKLKRWIGSSNHEIELFGFSDTSEKAFSCVIYTRTMNEQGKPIITLLAGKTRVAPLTQKTSLARLELCGCLLLSKLMKKVIDAYEDYKITIQAWSDSQVALAWIQGNISKWEKYVASRVTKIKQVIPAENWHYVKSDQNPADCASRGLYPSKLTHFNLWWQGPELLKCYEKEENVQASCLFTTDLGTTNNKVTTLATKQNDNFTNELLQSHSSLTRVIRVTAWILRFSANACNNKKCNSAYLTTSELITASKLIIQNAQKTSFTQEYKLLLKNQTVPKKSCMYKLSPYLDEDNIIRVGGRLNKSTLPLGMKNPAILPKKERITYLVILHGHQQTLHGGARETLNYIRQRYWIIGGNRAVKDQLRHCTRCARFNPTKSYQLMADLPPHRISPSRPFTHTGVDFTGNVEVKLNKGRGVKTSKGYIAVFVCMVTKAVHIELVSDMSTETFIAAFQRMCARRGTPKHVYSDCGTNFIGASKVLRKEFEEFRKILSPSLFDEIGKMEVEWHFNVPAWPSAGGIWEAAVKSLKHHLRRVLGDQKLTYEEFSTLLTKIEACMNSRPLCPLTEDPDEFYNCLTPGHFLTGTPMTSLPLSDHSDVRNIDLRRRWQLTEHMMQRFWKTWSNDYLHQLQVRSKWNTPTKNIKKDDIVLVNEDNLPPGKWALARVLEVHPGTDGYVRATTLKTQNGNIKRPIVKLAPLISEESNSTNETKINNEVRKPNAKKPARNEQSNKIGKQCF